MPNIAVNTGKIIVGNDVNFDNPKDYLIAVLNSNNWKAEELETGNSGYVKYKLTHPTDPREFNIYVYLKPVKWRAGRNDNEKQHQMQANVDMRGYNALQSETSKTVALGIYRDPQSEDYLICGWNAFEWGPNKGEKPFNYNIGVQTLAEAFKFGFSKGIRSNSRLVYAFKAEFIHYYLLNNRLLYGENSEQNNLKEFMANNTIYYGAPGTGKSHIVDKIIENKIFKRITFHPEYDNASFVGGYKPISVDDEIKYQFVPQIFTEIYVKAWKDLENKHYLVIEEINRGNCAEIFGDIFQLLDGKYSISPSKELREYLIKEFGNEDHEGIAGGEMRLPNNLIILATMNTSDQSLFPMDSAFKRRWNWEYVPIEYEENYEDGSLNESFEYIVKIDEKSYFKWIEFIEKINAEIKGNPNLGMDKCIGNYFVKPSDKDISIQEFIQKVVFYLWNDVFRDEENNLFDKGLYYEDFFPLGTKGIENTKKILKNLGVEIAEIDETQPVAIAIEDENPS